MTELEAEAKADPKGFYGNHVIGFGVGKKRIDALKPRLKALLDRVHGLDRG
ncbi:hypothetical protein [Bradyrhizobium sp. BR 10289]|uniref:hypothetical protein n=1 Tax=Bradyrhizobium sp. BR 10289 TaxID=2749993 RepID=UPI001C651FE0|nr:hypothetical protein [Bradyrhizobium sp. BR 10289]MBW7968610.1 hypothetical protein [Bradyrhizobium sp. BR 10289]